MAFNAESLEWIGGVRLNADAITNKILEDARQSASQTLREADARARMLRGESDRKIEQAQNHAMEQARRDCAELRDRMLRMAELDQRKELLAVKRNVIDMAFDVALQKMRAMKPNKARAFMKKLLMETAAGDERVIVSKGDEEIFDADFFEEINEALENAGKPGKLMLTSEARELGGGLILNRGGMDVSYTYPSLMAERRPALEAEAAGILFQ